MFVKENVPKDIRLALGKYVVAGVSTGGFLRAVLENNLTSACHFADDRNIKIIPDITMFVYHYLPGGSHGDKWNVNHWIETEWRNAEDRSPMGWLRFTEEFKDEMPALLSIRRERFRRELLAHPTTEAPHE